MIRFGTSGWRAIISDEFTFRNVRLVVQAIANCVRRDGVRDPRIVIGYDTRFLSERVAGEAAKVLSASHVGALLSARDAPTPAICLEIRQRGAQGGIYFTASHNPPEYNGLKYYDSSGAPAPTGLTNRIEEEIRALAGGPAERRGLGEERRIELLEPQESYLKHLRQSVDLAVVRAAGLRIALDLLWGTSREYLDRVLIEADVPVEVLHNFADPYFGGYSPEVSETNLAELKRVVVETGADLGLATDGDGDRFGVLQKDGAFVPAGEVVALLVDYLARQGRLSGGIARTVATSRLVDRVAAEHGLTVVETPVGFKYIAAELLGGRAVAGGEESAGFTVASHLPEKDGILAGLLVAEMLARRGVDLAAARAELRARHGPHDLQRLTLELTPERAESLAEMSAAPPPAVGGRPVESVSRIDGLWLGLGDGAWCLLRGSGTEPVVRIYAEGPGEQAALHLLHAARDLVLVSRA